MSGPTAASAIFNRPNQFRLIFPLGELYTVERATPSRVAIPHCNGVPEISTAITHLRDVLGDPTYESLARKGETMPTAAMVTYAYDQIDQARAELNAVSK